MMAMIEYSIEVLPEDTQVRGNAMASGDDDYDRQVEDQIIADHDGGNEWAWCTVKVTARARCMEGADYLDCCSYKDEEDFRESPYYQDMKEEAAHNLLRNITDWHNELENEVNPAR